jgi:23S rRNA (uracil1939-C5)-methyltransferase
MVTAGSAEIAIADLTLQGEGIGRLEDGSVVFVPGALPGERVRIRLRERRRNLWRASLVAVLDPSPQRRRPPCILADHCGGCSLQPLDDQAQADWKEAHLRQTLQRLGHLEAPLRPILPSPQPLGYRNRAVIPLERTPEGVLRAGFYRRGSHRIVNLSRCPVLDPRIDALIAPLKDDLEASGWPVDRHGGGGLRHLALRVGASSGEILITLVARSPEELPGLDDLAAAWMERDPAVVGVSLNLQPHPDNRLFGERTLAIQGRSWLRETFAGLDYRIGATSFFQINTAQAEAVVPLLHDALGPGPGRLIDAYCGIGTYSLPLAQAGWRVEGIEEQAVAVQLARANAEANGLAERARFHAQDVAAVLAEHLGGDAVDALLLDPPRKGLATAALAAIVAAGPPQLLYLSCDPATLARDLAQLCGDGPYRAEWLQPIDFFPNTSHVECLAVLRRREAR